MAGSFAPTITLRQDRSQRQAKTGLERSSGGLANVHRNRAQAKGATKVSAASAKAQEVAGNQELNVSTARARESDRASAFSRELSKQTEKKAPVVGAMADANIAMAENEAEASRARALWDGIEEGTRGAGILVGSLWDSAQGDKQSEALRNFTQPISELAQGLLSSQLTRTEAAREAQRLYIDAVKENPELADDLRKLMNNILPMSDVQDQIVSTEVDAERVQAAVIEDVMTRYGLNNPEIALKILAKEQNIKLAQLGIDEFQQAITMGELQDQERQQAHDDALIDFEVEYATAADIALDTLEDVLAAEDGVDPEALGRAIDVYAQERRAMLDNYVNRFRGQDSPFTAAWRAEQIAQLDAETQAYRNIVNRNLEMFTKGMNEEQLRRQMDVFRAAPVLTSIASLPGGQSIISSLLGPEVLRRGEIDPTRAIQDGLVQELKDIAQGPMSEPERVEFFRDVLNPDVPLEELNESGKSLSISLGLHVLSDPEAIPGDVEEGIGLANRSLQAFERSLFDPNDNQTFIDLVTSGKIAANLAKLRQMDPEEFDAQVRPTIEGIFSVGMPQYVSTVIGVGGVGIFAPQPAGAAAATSGVQANRPNNITDRFVLGVDARGAPQIKVNPDIAPGVHVNRRELQKMNKAISGTVRMANAVGLNGNALAESMLEQMFVQQVDVIVEVDDSGNMTFRMEERF